MNKAILIALIVCLAAVYLFQVQAVIQANYVSQNYMSEIRDMEDNTFSLGQQSVSSASLENIQAKVQSLGLVAVSEVRYIPMDYLAGK